MSSYIYMKVLESQPERYDKGISWLSFGASERIKQRIVDELVRPGLRLLEIGVGTATMAVLAAKKGAEVFGFDVSPGMLEVARKKVESEGLSEKIELKEMGVSGMDKLEDASFDIVASTLVFSELSSDEQNYALRQAFRVLKPGGRIALADETRPKSPVKYLMYLIIWIPLLVLTFALTQTSTRAVEGLEDRVTDAGFSMDNVEYGSLDTFIYLTAKKEARA